MVGSDEASGAAGRIAYAARVSIWESLKACGFFYKEIPKEELRQKIKMRKYLRVAMRTASTTKDVSAGVEAASSALVGDEEPMVAPEAPLVVFVNSKSGGRHGPELKERLHELISEEQVFDLQTIKPPDFVSYGLACLEQMAAQGDACAKDTREKLRIVVAGGDGTVGWLLGSLKDLYESKREPVPPTGIIPLGTGNDLSRTFGWGGSFPFAWRSAVKQLLYKAVNAPICRLDSWHLEIAMPEGELKEKPYSIKQKDKEMDIEGEMPEKISCYGGVFYNYFSIGMDAQVAHGFHHLRNEKPYLAQGPVANKMIYAGYSCTQGWFCTPCVATPNLRGLKNIVRLFIKRANCSEWEQIHIDSSVRSLVCLNLYNYGSGRHPWGDLKPDYLEKRGFVEAHADDGLLEIFGLKEGWHASFVMAEFIKAKHIAQAAAIKLELRGGQWNRAYLQIDGEPWKQPLTNDYSTFVEIKKMPYHSLLLNGE